MVFVFFGVLAAAFLREIALLTITILVVVVGGVKTVENPSNPDNGAGNGGGIFPLRLWTFLWKVLITFSFPHRLGKTPC